MIEQRNAQRSSARFLEWVTLSHQDAMMANNKWGYKNPFYFVLCLATSSCPLHNIKFVDILARLKYSLLLLDLAVFNAIISSVEYSWEKLNVDKQDKSCINPATPQGVWRYKEKYKRQMYRHVWIETHLNSASNWHLSIFSANCLLLNELF